MADTIREQIITAYVNHLSNMITANGFNHDCGNTVLRARKSIDVTPAVNLLPKPETAEINEYGQLEKTTTIRLEAVVAFDPTVENAEAIASKIQNELLGDMEKVMTGSEIFISGLSGLVTYIDYTGGGPADIPAEEDTTVAAYAQFEIKYSTLIGDPYQQ